jgi:glycosyltransferase involved in cell wall biosynthesis
VEDGVLTIPAAWAALTSCAWIAAAIAGLRSLGRVRLLREIPSGAPEAWPRLSVILAARDEAACIGPALDSIRAQDYPDLEVVAVDDRSSDGTGAILDGIAAADPRVRSLRVRALPDGWLGKVHALERGVEAATGEWFLFTDADVHFGPGSLSRAMAHALRAGLDHLVVAPEVRSHSTLQEAANGAFAAAFLTGTRALHVSHPGSDAYVGVGGFNLVRRAAWEATPGFAWLRMEVLDDVGLARMLRDAGARRDFVLGLGDVSVDWYGSIPAMIRGLEKNFFGAVARYSAVRAAAVVLASVLFVVGPAVGLAAGPPWVRLLAGLAIAAHVLGAVFLRARFSRPLLPFLLMPAGALILAYALARSAWLCLRRGGIDWRGTFYPLEALRRGRRIDL